ncbi:fructose PTS transporter subunit IIB [Aeromonas veronii]|uniref:PTS fructose transporter subunit IIB n=1 Tax=Aeromonas veronii TaxID=654 RepID=UPI003DA41AF6
MGYILGTILGALTTAVIVNILKKPVSEEEEATTTDSDYQVIEAEGEADVLAITACPSGVAHTFLAAKSLQKAAAKQGIKIKVETQGANGIINRITAKDVANARCVIFAHDVAIKNRERFTDIEVIDVKTKEAIHNPEALLARTLADKGEQAA